MQLTLHYVGHLRTFTRRLTSAAVIGGQRRRAPSISRTAEREQSGWCRGATETPRAARGGITDQRRPSVLPGHAVVFVFGDRRHLFRPRANRAVVVADGAELRLFDSLRISLYSLLYNRSATNRTTGIKP